MDDYLKKMEEEIDKLLEDRTVSKRGTQVIKKRERSVGSYVVNDRRRETVYVLELEGGMFYVGWTVNLDRRIKQHFEGNGSEWTKKYRPIKVIEVFESKTLTFECTKTLEYMSKYTPQRVRGGKWCKANMSKRLLEDVNAIMLKWRKEQCK